MVVRIDDDGRGTEPPLSSRCTIGNITFCMLIPMTDDDAGRREMVFLLEIVNDEVVLNDAPCMFVTFPLTIDDVAARSLA